jgi:hypothetical protein
MVNMNISSKEELKKYILVELGAPILKVELADIQMEQLIDSAIATFHRYNAGEGSIYEYGAFEAKAGKTLYNLRSIGDEVASIIGDGSKPPRGDELLAIQEALASKAWENSKINIESVIEVRASTGMMGAKGINDLFSPAHGWFYNGGGGTSIGVNPGTTAGIPIGQSMSGGYNNGVATSPGTSGIVTGGSMMTPQLPLSNFVQFKQQMQLIDQVFGSKILHVYRADAGLLTVNPTPKKDEVYLMRYWRREEAVFLYNNPLYKALVIALCGIKWGENVGKYSNTMAGGGSINADAIKSDYKEKLQTATENLKKESWQPLFRRG